MGRAAYAPGTGDYADADAARSPVWIDTFMKRALAGSYVKDTRACTAMVTAGAQDALPIKLVLGLVETSAATPCSAA